MHLLTTSSTNLDEIVEAVDLGQTPGDIVVLSFADSDLTGLAGAWQAERDALPSVRLAHLRDLRHPMSVDLWIDRVGAACQGDRRAPARRARLVEIRHRAAVGAGPRARHRACSAAGRGSRRYPARRGFDAAAARARRAAAASFAKAAARICVRCCGGSLATPDRDITAREPKPVPRLAGYLPGEGAVDLDQLAATLEPGKPVVPIMFYRALLLAADTAPIDALCAALTERGVAPAALVVTSLKDREAAAFLHQAFARLDPALIVTTTAFAAGGSHGEPTALDETDVPVLQVVCATTKRAAWRDSPRGLGAADLAMHVVLARA